MKEGTLAVYLPLPVCHKHLAWELSNRRWWMKEIYQGRTYKLCHIICLTFAELVNFFESQYLNLWNIDLICFTLSIIWDIIVNTG